MFSRDDYMAGKCTHRQYYAQFTKAFKRSIRKRGGPAFWREQLEIDENLNHIPIAEWDALAKIHKASTVHDNMRVNKRRVWSLSDGVCAAKEAARQIAEEKI